MKRPSPKQYYKLIKPYENRWVALSKDRTEVVSSGDTLKQAVAGVPVERKNDVAYTHIAPLDKYYIFSKFHAVPLS